MPSLLHQQPIHSSGGGKKKKKKMMTTTTKNSDYSSLSMQEPEEEEEEDSRRGVVVNKPDEPDDEEDEPRNTTWPDEETGDWTRLSLSSSSHPDHHSHTNMRVLLMSTTTIMIIFVILWILFFRQLIVSKIFHNPNTNNADNDDDSTHSWTTTSVVHYDSMPKHWDPFDLTTTSTTDFSDEDSFLPWMPPSSQHSQGQQQQPKTSPPDFNHAYFMQPGIFNGSLVFITQGNIFLTQLDHTSPTTSSSSSSAWKFTTNVGNVRTPCWHPTWPVVAFTATYDGRRDVYLFDFRRGTIHRITYWMDSEQGVNAIVGWKNSTCLIFSAPSNAVGLPDTRLYLLSLATTATTTSYTEFRTTTTTTTTPWQITPIPLSQAIDGVYFPNHNDNNNDNVDCLLFTRFEQSSNTVRYVGGTAESLWLYCDREEIALAWNDIIPHFHYLGASKNPHLYTINDDNMMFVLFLSDRTWNETSLEWYPTSMNLWALPWNINNTLEFYRSNTNEKNINLPRPIQLTQVSCHFNGMALKEYSADPITGDIVLRIGADFYLLTRSQVESVLNQGLPPPAPTRLSIHVYSDYHETMERLLPLDLNSHYKGLDIFVSHTVTSTSTISDKILSQEQLSGLLTVRGQVWVSPVLPDSKTPVVYQGSGQAMPPRTYRLAPGSLTGGAMRVLAARSVSHGRAMVLATDPLSPTAEHAFYLVDGRPNQVQLFNDLNHWPKPFLGGGNEASSFLGSVRPSSLVMSPSGRRMAWADTNGRICVVTLPQSSNQSSSSATTEYTVLPDQNELGEPMLGTVAELSWSPGGRYLAVNHLAANAFYILSIVDCGDPESLDVIQVGRVVQATPSRFNSFEPYWGTHRIRPSWNNITIDSDTATALYFLTDRDVMTDTSSPWGTRMPYPHFSTAMVLYALPLIGHGWGQFAAGGASEIMVDESDNSHNQSSVPGQQNSTKDEEEKKTVPKDLDIDFGAVDLSFARTAYRVGNVPKAKFIAILSQTPDGSFVMVIKGDDGVLNLDLLEAKDYPFDDFDETLIPMPTAITFELSTCRNFVAWIQKDGVIQVVPNELPKIMAAAKDSSVGRLDTNSVVLSIWPTLEYQQMYNDAWRMLRDYFYDRDMHQVDWKAVHQRYLPLVERCHKREELDDILEQMAAELSALHVFVYGGEYSVPLNGDSKMLSLYKPASLGATLERCAEWKGYRITEIAYRDPDYNLIEGKSVYSPLSNQALRLSGQRGLQAGDVIVGVNGESTFRVPDIGMLLRGQAGKSVRLEVLRLASGGNTGNLTQATPETVVVVPISQSAASDLRQNAWEFKTRQKAKALATQAGFTVGYIHLRGMMQEDMDSFARGYFEDYDKDAMILDLRHNRGGNIDSWILSFLQRKSWSYFGDRTEQVTGRDMNWNQQFAFRGHLVVLIDEKTASDGEGIARSLSELGIGFLIGKRTWGGGIWLASDNVLVDGGVATAPEMAVYNQKWGWGLGIEQQGVSPDLEVDNNPRLSFAGDDTQLEFAIQKLQEMLAQNPVTLPKPPLQKPDMSLKGEKCIAV